MTLTSRRTSLQYRVFVIFQVTVLPALILAQVEPRYDLSRKTYKQLPFALSMVLAEMPYSLLCAVAFFITIYYPAGFNLQCTNHPPYDKTRRLTSPPHHSKPSRLLLHRHPHNRDLLRHPRPNNLSPHAQHLHRRPPQPLRHHRLRPLLRRRDSETANPRLLARLAIPTRPFHPPHLRARGD